jgi:hypothetical protein
MNLGAFRRMATRRRGRFPAAVPLGHCAGGRPGVVLQAGERVGPAWVHDQS